ncbi:MAG: hypothetical protein DME25_06880 [Verrucomicrobia bacterium]|nr:MAG: hypothetical protein DME25_06880 [Verrucomicrobiota bacterium]
MKSLLALLLSCTGLLASDDIRLTTTAKTNAQTGRVTVREVFTRGGHTNLVRVTTSKEGMLVSRVHRFYYHRKLVADHMMLPGKDTSFMTTTAGFSLSLDFGPSKAITRAYIGNKKGEIIEAYTTTDGILTPVSASELKSIRKSTATWGEW